MSPLTDEQLAAYAAEEDAELWRRRHPGQAEPKRDQVPPTSPPTLDGSVGGEVLLRVNGAVLAASTTTIADLPYLPLLGAMGWFIEGWSHLLSGYPRVGKTDLTVAIVRDWLARGRHVLYISEEPKVVWETRLAGMPGDWSGLEVLFGLGVEVEVLRREARQGIEDVVVVDALRNLLQLKDEKDNSEIARVTNPWVGDARTAGKTLVMLHHNRKGGGEHGEGIAGGHALMGAFDIVIELLRDPNQAKNRRLLRSYARLIESQEAIYEKTETGSFQLLGDPRSLELEEVMRRVRPLVIDDLQTTKDIHSQLGEPRPSQEQVRLALDKLARNHEIRRDPPIESGSQAGKTYRWGSMKMNPANLTSNGGS